jgi:hypothetical protein
MHKTTIIFKTKLGGMTTRAALISSCTLLVGCPPLIVPNLETHGYDQIYSFPDPPRPWLTLESDGVALYQYQSCDKKGELCSRQNIAALKSATSPNWKNLLESYKISQSLQGDGVPMYRPLSAYVPGTRYRLMGSFGYYPDVIFLDPDKLENNDRNGWPVPDLRSVQIEDRNSLAQPDYIDVQLVIYDDDHRWIFINTPKLNHDTLDRPTAEFVPSKLFHFENADDPRLNQPMELFYSTPEMASRGYRVVSGKAAEWRVDAYNMKFHAEQIGIADITFPSAPLKLDTRTTSSTTVAGNATLLCHYSHTQFNLGWMDAGERGGPSEAYRKRCEPFVAQDETTSTQ